ncbi:MAG: hydroxyacylglutathione hydrolase [Gammaproteobacteria bacterium]
MITVTAIPALQDNYIWALVSETGGVVIVDPGAADPVIRYFDQKHCHLEAILLTHHHPDHIDGVEPLLGYLNTQVPVYGPFDVLGRVAVERVHEADRITLPSDMALTVLSVPGHTTDHVAYQGDGLLFPGDTLFSAGCGRLFEGRMEDLFNSVQRLGSLNPTTRTYPAHEYTLANLAFAATLEPDNRLIAQYRGQARKQRMQNRATLPTTVGLEHAVNPFLRTATSSIRTAAEHHAGKTLRQPFEIFRELRLWKDHFIAREDVI